MVVVWSRIARAVGRFEHSQSCGRPMNESGNGPENELRSRNLRMLALLAGLFLLPLASAFWMYYATEWRPARSVNHGELITPVRPLPVAHLQPVTEGGAPAELFHRKWSLVYV